MSNTLTYKGGGVIQIMNTSDLNALSQQVLEFMASNNGPGAIYNASGTGNVLIGTFTDTRYSGNVGEGNVTVLSSTSDLYQDLSTPTGTEPPRPLRYTSSSSPMQSMSDAQVNTLADSILQYCVLSEGPFSYQLANTTPSDGGTWTSVGQFNDTSNTTTVFYLWKKLNSGSYTITRPLRSLGNGTIQAFTNTEITQLSKKVRERIVNTGVGQYLLQSSTPTPGTWVSKGSVTDTRPTISDANYDGSIEVGYTTDTYTGFASFSGFATFGGFVPANYTGPAFQTFTGPGPATYTGQGSFVGVETAAYIGPGNMYYTGPGPATTYTGATVFVGSYLGPSFSEYIGPNLPATFIGATLFGGFTPANYIGPAFQQFVGPSPQTYTGAGFFSGVTPTSYFGPVFQTFTGPGPTTYIGATLFGGFAPVEYTGPGAFTGPGTPYTGPALFTGPDTPYTGPGAFNGPGTPYTGPGAFTGPGTPYTGPALFTGPSLTYTGPGTFSGPGPEVLFAGGPSVYVYTADSGFSSFAGSLIVNYITNSPSFQASTADLGPDYSPAYYYGPGPEVGYDGLQGVSYSGPAIYAGPFPYFGPGPLTPYTVEFPFTGSIQFTGEYPWTAPTPYTGEYPWTAPTPANYTGNYFTGTGPTTYQSNPDTTPFTGFAPTNYAGFQIFSGFIPTSYQSNPDSTPFTGPSPINYTGNYYEGVGPFPQYYSYIVPNILYYVGPQYTGDYFTGPSPDQFYVTLTPDLLLYFGPSPVTYVGFQNFSGTAPTSYQSNPDTTPFTGPSPVTYTGPAEYLSSADYVSLITYTGTVGAVYTGSVINDDRSTISTLTLWRRVA